MAGRNAHALRRLADAFNRADLQDFLALCDPSVEFVPLTASIEGHRRGHEGVESWWIEMRTAFTPIEVESHEVLESGDWSLATGITRGRAAESGMPIEWSWVWVGQHGEIGIRWWRFFRPPEAAFQALREVT